MHDVIITYAPINKEQNRPSNRHNDNYVCIFVTTEVNLLLNERLVYNKTIEL